MPKLPCFFFSYARKDHSPYLRRFFKELKGRVATKGVLDDEQGEVSFRDIDDIEPGNDWEQALAEALARALTMVSIYSPWYFSRPYCGKEFRVFLDRQPGVIYDDQGQARASEKIVPVLWESWEDLTLNELPPPVARFVNVVAGEHEELYRKLGLRKIWIQRGRRGPFTDILEMIASLLVQLAKTAPLSQLPQPPSLAKILNAFERPSSSRAITEAGEGSLLLVYLTACVPASNSRADRYGTRHAGDWRPFEMNREEAIHSVVRETASKFHFVKFVEPVYDWAFCDVSQNILKDLLEATSRNVIALVLLDPWFAATDRGQKILQEILTNERWRGGVLAVADAQDAETMKLLPQVESNWQVPRALEDRLYSVTSRGAFQEFLFTLTEVLTELQSRVAGQGPIRERVEGTGPATVPSLHGAGRRQSRG